MFIPEEWSEESGQAGVGDSGGMQRGAVEQGAELEKWRLPGHHASFFVRN